MKNPLSIIALVLGMATSAQAHHVWLEQTQDGVSVLRFGEYAQNLREASPGLLDQFVKPTATLLAPQGNRNLPIDKSDSGFEVDMASQQRLPLLAYENRYPLLKSKKDGIEVTNWFYPAARQIVDFSAVAPALPLDLVPSGKPGGFTIYYQNKPLAKSKVSLITQSGWSQHAYSDDAGQVKFTMPWTGQYVAEVKHIDTTAGVRDRDNYDQITYVTTVSFVHSQGLAPIPAGPAKAPKK